jgi:S-formylglutathione hydrolase FrmB
MPPRRRLFPAAVSAFLLLGLSAAPAFAQAKPLEFHVTFDKAVSDQPFTGRVYVMLSKRDIDGVVRGVSWFQPEPFFARDVKDWKPGEPLVIGADAPAFPAALAKLPAGSYSVQALMDFDRGSIHFSAADGNGYSKAVRRELNGAETGPVALKIDQVYEDKRSFKQTDRVKLVEIESKLLTAFNGRPTHLRAGVVLPKSFSDNPKKRYPVIYEIPGFGGDHFGAQRRNASEVGGIEVLYVVLDPSCRLGHHVFADSANNGPCGKALIEELIPQIEKEYRGLGTPAGRAVTGHSSGGWSSLWLQVAYPDFFGGVWSTAPDPVDFRDFQRINVYRKGENMFKDAEGKDRPLARAGGKPTILYKPFSDMEWVMGHGGQLGSFEAVFSERGADGKPKQLWDRKTGAIDPEVAQSWERYDIRLVLERNWKTLGPKLAGKVHVYMGDQDTFYLEGATVLLKESLKNLGSDAAVELFPGKNHGSLMDAKLRDRIAREMAEQFRKAQPSSE